MFCPKCGKPINDGAEFCPFCGSATSHAKSTTGADNSSMAQNSTPVQSSVSSSKNKKFWEFIWCDSLYILIFLEIIVFGVLGTLGTEAVLSVTPVTVLTVLLNIVTLVLWKANKNKPALILLIVDMVAPILRFIATMLFFTIH